LRIVGLRDVTGVFGKTYGGRAEWWNQRKDINVFINEK